MTYDQWKTTDPREYERELEEDQPTELDLAYDRIQQLERRLMALDFNHGWQQIESAPQDGTHILVCFADPPYSKHWTFMQRPPTVAHWFGPPNLPGLRAGGWYLSVNQSDSDRIHPTHWMPLPHPPAERTGHE